LGGIKDMTEYPQAGFIVDPKREDIAVREFRRLGIPIVAITDTNCDPDVIDYIIPGNDDAIRAIKLFSSRIAEACLEGKARQDEVMEEFEPAQEKTESTVSDQGEEADSQNTDQASAEEE
jgi:small subunit ribosomal protein S2